MRVGIGYDVHAYGDGDHVTLGGVRIAHTRGVIAHSDGDVAIHALCDALLGAAGLGDIGRHFPDTDAAYAGTAHPFKVFGDTIFSNIAVCPVPPCSWLCRFRGIFESIFKILGIGLLY